MGISGTTHAAHQRATADAQRAVDTLFARCDVLLAPSATGEAPLGVDATGDPVFCRGWTLLGLPCVHLPFFRGAHGLPMGLQLVGRFGADAALLAAAHWVHERLLG
jgi:Asp-tRNA(Asn)/Glu-tRNA(Gln) amidotransferase A subunit family amidase